MASSGSADAAAPSSLAPADLLRHRLTRGRGRLAVIVATTTVWLMDLLLAQHLERDQVIEPAMKGMVTGIERLGTVIFVVVTIGLVAALLRGRRRALFRWGLVYLCFSVLQVIANVLAMIFTAGHHKGAGLASLWDVGAVYMGTPEKDFRGSTSNSPQKPRVFKSLIHADTEVIRFHKDGLRIPLGTLSDSQSPSKP